MKKLTRAQRKRKRLRELDGAFSGILGAELVKNGDFATDPSVDWTITGSWTWNEPKELMDNSNTAGNLEQSIAISDTKSYLLEFDVIGVFGFNGLQVVFSNSAIFVKKTGRWSGLVKAGTNAIIKFNPQSAGTFEGILDNVSVREIL